VDNYTTPKPGARASTREIKKLEREYLRITKDDADAGDVYAAEALRRYYAERLYRKRLRRAHRACLVAALAKRSSRPRAPHRSRPAGGDDSGGGSDDGDPPRAHYDPAKDRVELDPRARERLARAAGMPHPPKAIDLSSARWKKADSKYFKNHPYRSHRLRPAREGELEALTDITTLPAVPPGYAWFMIVRQIASGIRLRCGFRYNLAVPVPDSDAILSGLFDIVAKGGDPTKYISVEDVLRESQKYQGKGARQ
jgi:hypothetical protein